MSFAMVFELQRLVTAKDKKPILILVVLNIILPTLDTLTDLNLIFKLYRGAIEDSDGSWSNHPKMATAMLTPFLLNYVACFAAFLMKEKNKKYNFIFALLNIYPQFGKNDHQEKSLE